MAQPTPSGSRTGPAGRPRKSSTATNTLPLVPGTPAETSTPSAMGAPPATMTGHSVSASVGPATLADCELLSSQMLDPKVPYRRKIEISNELRDSAESNRDFAFYEKYLGVFVPMLVTILSDEKTIVFVKEPGVEWRVRYNLLTFLQRLPHTEPYRQHESTILGLMIKILRVENEENAMMCIKIIVDGFRSAKDAAEPHVDSFLELVKQMYANIKGVVEKEFGLSGGASAKPAADGKTEKKDEEGGQSSDAPASTEETLAPPPSAAEPAAQPSTADGKSRIVIAHALHSPKVLTECPIAVVLIFQTYKQVMGPAMLDFYPLVLESIKIQPEPQRLAHLQWKERGEIFTGVADGIQNREMYAELIKAQVKTMAFLAYVLRGSQGNIRDYIDVFPEACVRLLRDCPPEDVSTRKELLVATRHILTIDSKASFLPFIDIMLEEKVLVGTGITSRETLRSLAYSVVADLIHHTRSEIPPAQLMHVVYIFSCALNDTSFPSSIQTMCAKLLNTISDSIAVKLGTEQATHSMRSIFFAALQKLSAMCDAHDRLKALSVRDKGKAKAKVEAPPAEGDAKDKGKAKAKQDVDGDVEMEDESKSAADADRLAHGWREIEQNMPVHQVTYANDSLENFCREARYLFKTLLHLFRTLLTITRQGENPLPQPDGDQLGDLFRYSLRALAIFDGIRDPREPKESIELLTQILLLYNPHSFREVWSVNMNFFIENSLANMHVFSLIQVIIPHDAVSHQLVAICLKYLMDSLEDIGKYSKQKASLTLRLFKMSFLAINQHIATNEAVLVPHLQKLIMGSFSLAPKSPDPTIYYQILRALFRSIGGGRFEALYKEVLPILQEMLDNLSYLLQHARDEAQRDLFVELMLTVPVRLTNLLPLLGYLMKPLVLALQAGHELISQGLRTLELCIDNLTADFLDPTMMPIYRDLMNALYQLLKPIPANRPHAHTAVKILGKLGGRNRKFPEVENLLEYKPAASDYTAPISFEGKTHRFELGPLVTAAKKVVDNRLEWFEEDGLEVLMMSAMSVLQKDQHDPEGSPVFRDTLSSLFRASCQTSAVGEKAKEFVRSYCKRIFGTELRRGVDQTDDEFVLAITKRRQLPLTSALVEVLVLTLSETTQEKRPGLADLLGLIIGDFKILASNAEFMGNKDRSRDIDRFVHNFFNRFTQLCYEEDWSCKMAGVTAMDVFVRRADLSRRYVIEHELEFVRTLLFALRDAPKEAPSSVDDIIDLIHHLIRICQSQEDGKGKLGRLTEILVRELNSQKKLSREAAQSCIKLLAEVTEQSISELITDVARAVLLDRATGPIFLKPLRALPFPVQVGHIDCVTYLLNLRPSIPEITDEFVRLVQEVVALADVDDSSLVQNKPPTHRQEYWLKTLRVSCIKMLCSTMDCTEFFEMPNLSSVKQRILTVYFKHVYSPSPEIVDAAHEGLRHVLQVQAKLPKDVLQTGLRPILVNLADAKRLSVSGLEGLARFLELLHNYFKVEIGVKLLDHFETLSDQQMLAKAASGPLDDNPDIARMTRLVTIFRLLPPTAVQYMKTLSTRVIEVESALCQSTPGPFTEVLGKYFDRYHVEAAQHLLDNMRNERLVWTFRNIIASGFAPQLVTELCGRVEAIYQLCFADFEALDIVMPGLYIVRELSRVSPALLSEESVLEPLVNVWRALLQRSRDHKSDMSGYNYQIMPGILLEMFMTSLKHQQHVPLLFHLVEAYEIRSAFDRSAVAFFLYQHAALQESIEYRREVIDHFLLAYDSESVSWAFKTNALRLVVNPTLLVYFNEREDSGKEDNAESLITTERMTKIAEVMLHGSAVKLALAQHNDSLIIEFIRCVTLLVQHCSAKIEAHRKLVFMLSWTGINLLEPTVKLMAYVLVSRFMQKFDSPAKFVRLTWTGLLRLKDNESRSLFRQALDTLASCITVRDPMVQGAVVPDWASKVRTVLVDEGQQTGTLVTVCELLVNHPDLFFDYRDLYVPYIAQSLPKLGFVQAGTPEMKKLSVDVVELIFRWEKKRMAIRDEAMEVDGDARESSVAPSPLKRQRVDRAGTAISSHSGGGWATPTSTRELILAHLLRLVAQSSDPVARGGLSKRALDLFKEMLGPKGLPNVLVKMAYFTRPMSQEINDNTIATVANSTEAIAALAEVRDQAWVKVNLETLRRLLEKVWLFDDAALHDIIRPLTERMFVEMPEEEIADSDEDDQKLLKFVSNAVNNGLAGSLRTHSELPGTIFLLRCWLKVQPKVLLTESIASGLIKVLSGLAKHHTTVTGPDTTYRHIISILDIIRDRLGDLKDQRRYLLNLLAILIDKSSNAVLCRYLLDLVRQWVVKDLDGPLIAKDKAGLLMRMAAFESRDANLFKQYLDLIYEVYELDTLSGTDLTHKLEPAFLLGTRSNDTAQRARFLDKLEQTLPNTLNLRLQYLYSVQNWETLADYYWIPQLFSLVLGVADSRDSVLRKPLPKLFDDDPLQKLSWRLGDVVRYLRTMVHVDSAVAHQLWVEIFPACWSSLSRTHQTSFTPYVSKLLAKDYHFKQAEMRPNVIKTLLEAIAPCKPPVTVPPVLIKYLAKTFNAWHAGFEILTALSEVYRGDDMLRDSCATALGELYNELGEDDMFYGLARGRCVFPETTAGLTLEQNGRWPQATDMYEQAQTKARNGHLPFSEEEYCFWEDHWILAAQKLQQWESLTELARADSDADLLLECAWRLSDWGSPDREMIETNLRTVAGTPTPRRKIFEAFTALIKAHTSREPPDEFLRIVDEAQQVAIRKWISLPSSITGAHLPLLQLFQQVVELGEASSVFDSLQMTAAHNLELRVNTDLKSIFTTWRERLPNFWDDISVWSDLLAWRQHIFQAVTKVYIPMIAPGETATHGYRGYHETAWMINRFGEVARRHGLLDVCSTALNRIYSLPNIEISEAFLKLREQALCYFQRPDKFNEGLDNISTTNLVYFAPSQKAEFLMLKGMFISQLGQDHEANAEFAHAVQMDFTLPKAWAEWGKFNEKMYRQQPEQAPPGGMPEPAPGEQKMSEAAWAESWAQDRALRASSAVSCYMQAANLYANHKSRALHLRILWLLGLDDSHSNIAKAFEAFKSDIIVWYWITLIPQLLLSLSHREAKIARSILMLIAKKHPQALFYSLRVAREDFSSGKKQAQQALRSAALRKANEAKAASAAATPANGESSTASPKVEGKEVAVKDESASQPASATANGSGTPQPAAAGTPAASTPTAPQPRQPWELADDIYSYLKTQHPFLALCMEKMVDQFQYRAKPASDEDIYRFFSALLNDAMVQWSSRGGFLNDDTELNQSTKENLIRFATNLQPDIRGAIERDFVKDVPKLREYIRRLQFWRDLYERALDARPKHTALDQQGVNMSEFHLSKSEDVEVPGQYVQHIDPSEELVKIARFHPRVEYGRAHGFCFRRITMIGHNGVFYPFTVQMPAARHCRREDRLMQLFRIMNSVLRKRKESRRRNLQFHLPIAVALGAQIRLLQSDSSYVSLQDIYDDFVIGHGQTREDTILEFCDQQRQLHDPVIPKSDNRSIQLKVEIMERIQAKMLPETVLTNYMIKHMADSESLWLMRKQFALQTASTAFMTYVCCLSNRAPSRFHLSRKTGQMYMTEVLPSFAGSQSILQASETVPFRLTPNMQNFITRVGVEGVVTSAVTAIANCLTMPEFDLASTLHLFIRDEILSWTNMHGKNNSEVPLTSLVYKNVDQFIRRAELMGVIAEAKDKTSGGPLINHAVVTLISQATAPTLLVSMNENFMAWF